MKKLTKRQAAVWMAIGEAAVAIYGRVIDLSLPDHVALDRAWLIGSLQGLVKLFSRWEKTLPKPKRTPESAERAMSRRGLLMDLMPHLVVEAMGPGTTAHVTYDGKTVTAGESPVVMVTDHAEPN